MTIKEKAKSRGRPRSFDEDAALSAAQALFHHHGYDGVGVAALAQAMGINPPSLYAAFGDKAALFDRVLARYARNALPVDDILVPGTPPATALTELLRTAARIYAADPAAPGCMVLEAARGADAIAAAQARCWKDRSVDRVRDYLAPGHPEQALPVADYMVAVMSGLSSDARNGKPVERLLAIADMAGLALKAALASR
ncbi:MULTISPECIES: TetR/AcrR family transcriptional regulator [Sphingobium]|jgi:TetR/AcrR family transcriptional repressor for divergent bdcA|uniref:TetR/AcrR family transcriptional regulator n=1 Tax=Sphingobium yanoikuyae TaxID=13690 RepID=A0A9X7YE52_SPHYA|nr:MULTISPECIES: TetR/AcrR family transcriptional regulator [Sphingobium]PZU67549.1 MAG: TetR/AcrR family transcriptional regulator [Sphingobium sp.]QNG46793.1 TetR/AcrR family transcriptional regulator [Sphingobium yanoikuyae]